MGMSGTNSVRKSSLGTRRTPQLKQQKSDLAAKKDKKKDKKEKERGASRLKKAEMAMAGHLLDMKEIHDQQPDAPIDSIIEQAQLKKRDKKERKEKREKRDKKKRRREGSSKPKRDLARGKISVDDQSQPKNSSIRSKGEQSIDKSKKKRSDEAD